MATDQARIRLTAENQTGAAFQAVKSAMAGVQSSAVSLNKALTALGAGLSIGAVGALAKQMIVSAAALEDVAEKTGSTVEKLSQLQNVARIFGHDFDGLTSQMIKFSSVLAGQGTEDESRGVGAALKRLNLSADELRGKDPAENIRRLAQELQKYESDAGKSSVVTALLGKGAAQYLPFLKDIAEQTSVAASVTAKQAAEAGKLEDALKQLAVQSYNAKQSLLLGLVPALNQAVGQFVEGTKAAGGFINAILLFGTINPFKNVGENLKSLRGDLESLERDKSRYLRSGPADTSGIDAAIDSTKKRIEFLKGLQRQEALSGAGGDTPGESRRAFVAKPSLADFKIPERPKSGGTSPFDAAVKSLEQEAIKVDNLSRRFEILRGIQQGLYGVLTPLQAKRLDDLASEVDKTRELQAVAKADLEARTQLQKIAESNNKLAADAIANLQDEREAMTQTTKVAEVLRNIERGRYGEINAGTSERLQSIAREIDAQRELMKARQEDIEAQKYLAAEVEKLNKPSKTQEEIFQKLASSFEDAITSGSKLRDVLRGLGQDLLKIFIRQQITEPLGKASQPLFNSIGSGIGEIFAGLFRAEGGPVSARSPYIVGERGPELFVPNSSGTIIPNNKLAAGGGVTVVQNISFGSDVNRSTMGAWAQQIKRETMAAVADQVQRGGAYASAFR